METACQKRRLWGAVAAAYARPPWGCWLLKSLFASHFWPHQWPCTSTALHIKGATFHARWNPTSKVMTRVAMPGGPGTQEHIYVKQAHARYAVGTSPRLMYALPDDDPGAPLLPPTPRPAPRSALPAPCPPYAALHYAPSLRPACCRVRSHEPCEDHEPRRPSTVANVISCCHAQFFALKSVIL